MQERLLNYSDAINPSGSIVGVDHRAWDGTFDAHVPALRAMDRANLLSASPAGCTLTLRSGAFYSTTMMALAEGLRMPSGTSALRLLRFTEFDA